MKTLDKITNPQLAEQVISEKIVAMLEPMQESSNQHIREATARVLKHLGPDLAAMQKGNWKPLVSDPQMHTRLLELEAAVNLGLGPGFVEAEIESLIWDIKNRSPHYMILDGWEFDKGAAWARDILDWFRDKWNAEDGGAPKKGQV